MNIKILAMSALAMLCSAAMGAAGLESEAMRSAKGALVLQVGSDWCVSGEDVRKAFESSEFKRLAGAKYALGVFDDMDTPTDAVKAKNEFVKPLLIRTKRFPAITCYTPAMKVFAQIENVPNSVNGEKLAKAVMKQTAKKNKAEDLFKKAAAAKGEEAANLYGQAFDILASMMGPFHFKELTSGAHGWRSEWDELVKLDAGDKFGWLAHFRMDEYETVKMVEKVTTLKETSKAQAKQFVEETKAIPDAHFTPNQKQCVLVMEYALEADGSGGSLTPNGKRLLREAFALGRDTLWGQFAMGRLMMDGDSIESKGLYHAKVRPRPTNKTSGIPPAFQLDKAKSDIKSIKPGTALNEQQKLAIARYAALRLIGQEGWQKLVSRPGSAQFVKAFLNDRVWLEDFAWSGTFPETSADGWSKAGTGPGDGAAAVLALESLIFQDNGRWVEFDGSKFEDNEGRRFMTALAQNYPEKDEAWLADVLDAYRNTALGGRLHKSAYTQPVWMWRFATHQGHGTSGCDNMAAQQRHLDKFVNLPQRELGGTPWMIVYRLKNCFGDSVHGPLYYKAWATANEWPKRKYSQMVGGVCGELSKFGSAICNAHGLPSSTVGQPGHCAYSRRRSTDGKWEIDYNVTGHSQMHLCFWNKHPWQYVAALENMFNCERETRLGADRILALASLAEDMKRDDKTIEKYYQSACATHRGHYGAWDAYGNWLMRTEKPIDQIRVWVRGCARGMKAGRQPLWDILTPYFRRLAKEKGADALKNDLIEFAPLLRQNQDTLQEESDFKTNLVTWAEGLGKDQKARYDVLKAMLAAQFGTPNYFSQTMDWGNDFLSTSAEGVKLLNKCLNEALEERAKDAKGGKAAAQLASGSIDFGPLLLTASKNRNLEVFRQMVKIQKSMAPISVSGSPYPKNDFGGELLSANGLIRTSSTCGHDKPARYPLCIDESPCGPNGFHTDNEESPWAEVMLPGPAGLKGIVIENRAGGYNATRQVPMEVSVSADGENWQIVQTFDKAQDTYRIDLRSSSPRAQFVRVARKQGAKKEVFHLNKILVYGTRFW